MNQPQQLELPQISLGRYLELLKRRRWRVIPVSLLGLLVGGLVAFLIPRYYVAQIVLDHTRAAIDEQLRPNEDAFAAAVDNAMHTLPFAVGETMRKLGWDEAMETDPYQLRENERAVENRVSVADMNPGKGRTFAKIVVSYKDLDGKRAADFLNTLVSTWIEQRLAEMHDAAERARRVANERYNAALGEYNRVNDDLRHLAQEYGFERDLSEPAQREQLKLREQARQQQEKDRTDAEARVQALTAAIAALQDQIAQTPRSLTMTALDMAARLPEGLAKNYVIELQKTRESLENVQGEAHPWRRSWEQRVTFLEAKLRELLGDQNGEPTNPVVKQLQDDLQHKQEELAGVQKQLELLKTRIAAEDELQQRRLLAETDWIAKNRGLDEAGNRLAEARTAVEKANEAISELTVADPIKRRNPATVPPRPTEPNIFLVAGLGCILGLGVAIGLILLLDFLQSTLKTVDDVERALPVPVLGGMSHLETEEERVRTVSGRRRASLLAGAFLFATVVVVTIYYVDPTRLPPFARDLLSLVLGN